MLNMANSEIGQSWHRIALYSQYKLYDPELPVPSYDLYKICGTFIFFSL